MSNQIQSPNVKTDSEGKYLTLFFGLTCPREQLYAKINQRVDLMIKSGLIDEVKRLLSLGYKEDLNSMQAVGYRQIASYLRGDLSLSEAVRKISQDTRRYAKRQLTWFRQDKRIFWVEVEGRRVEEVVEEIEGKIRRLKDFKKEVSGCQRRIGVSKESLTLGED